jgi:tetratricopeptide (TPR) repeat protein
MTNTITAALQKLSGVRVIAPSSTARYRNAPKPLAEVARELDVDAVLQGGVLPAGTTFRLDLALIHVLNNRTLWHKSYDEPFARLPLVQRDVVRDVAQQTGAAFTREPSASLAAIRPVNPEAQDLLLHASSGGDPSKSLESLDRAVQLDPSYATAHEQRTWRSYSLNMSPTLPPRDTFPEAAKSAQRALALDPALGVPHWVLGSVALEYDWRFREAEDHFRTARRISPNGPMNRHMYAHYLLAMDRLDEAQRESEGAMKVDPLNAWTVACVSWHDITEHAYEQAERRALQALKMGAPDQLARLTLGWSYQLRGRHADAIAEFQKAVVGWKNAVFPTASLGHAYAVAGDQPAAREVLGTLLARAKSEYVSPYEIAVIHAGLGDKDRAFEWLEKAFADRSTFLVYFRMDPRIWSLRDDPRFQDLLARMNFPESARR